MNNDWKAFLTDAGGEFDGDIVTHYGNPVREQAVSLTGGVFADLSHYGLLACTGSEVATFLQAQFSNDIADVDGAHSQLSAYCTPKGRTLAIFRIFQVDDTYYLRLPLDILDAVIKRLRMYVIRADVAFEDVSESIYRFGISGAHIADEIADLITASDNVNGVATRDGVTILRIPGLEPRFEIFTASIKKARSLWETLNVRGAPVGESAWRLLEILAGQPAVYADTSELFVPQMLNLQLLDGVNFKKGCYPGQEIVARMHYLGTLKRRMYLGRIDSDSAITPGGECFSGGDSSQSVGRIVDAQPHPDGGQSALAVFQIKSIEAGDVHYASNDGPAFIPADLPYPFE